MGDQDKRRAPSRAFGSGSQPKPGTLRAKAAAAEETPRPAVAAQASGEPAPPAGYPADILEAMAVEFARLAYKHRVNLGDRGVRYVAKVMSDLVAITSMQKVSCTDDKGVTVRGSDLGVRVVRYFWDRWPWDRSRDVLRQFVDPVTFDECLEGLKKVWEMRRVRRLIDERMKNDPPPGPERKPRRQSNEEDN